eukprot:scaffold167580_cov43-Tisochrysis_lutea.AAC.1
MGHGEAREGEKGGADPCLTVSAGPRIGDVNELGRALEWESWLQEDKIRCVYHQKSPKCAFPVDRVLVGGYG